MKYKILLFALLIAGQFSYAQYKDNEDEAASVQDISRVTFLSPGLGFEKSIGKKQSLSAHVFISPSIEFSVSDALGTRTRFYLDPTLDIFYRYYYNGNKRAEAGKITKLNNMNYVAAVGEFVASKRPISNGFESDKVKFIKKFGAVWGMQRNFPGRFSLDLSIGLGALFGERTQIDDFGTFYYEDIVTVTSLGQFTLGIWLNKK